jgi:hypothetical protein
VVGTPSGSTLSFLLFWPFCLDYQSSNMWRVCTMHPHTPHALYVRSFGEFSILRTLVHIMSCHALHYSPAFLCPPPSPPPRLPDVLLAQPGSVLGAQETQFRPLGAVHISFYCAESAFYGEFCTFLWFPSSCGCGGQKKTFFCTWEFANNLLF